MIGWNSIRGRLLWLSTLWLTCAMIAAYLIIGSVLKHFVITRFDAETSAVADMLMATTSVDTNGLAHIYDSPADPRFTQPLSGWYWQVAANGTVFATSDSLFQSQISSISDSSVSGVKASGPDGAALRLMRRAYTIPGSNESLTVTVTAPQTEIDMAFAVVRRPLAITLAVLGIGLVLAALLQVTAGLASLRRMGHDLRAVREGDIITLPRPDVVELQPVADEINALLIQNRAQLSRSREQIGNLAHSLKTPLMALQGELPDDDPRLIVISRMDRQIAWHLKRARSTGGQQILGHITPLDEVIDDILLVLSRQLEDNNITVSRHIEANLTLPIEREDVQEIIGNLLENSAKWANSQITIRAKHEAGHICINVSDDGPGMANEDHAKALSRGARLDERGPGAGLGLAIVADLAHLHQGELSLSRDARLGGLNIEITLPG